MASTYTPLGIEKMATGENAGTWGTKTNTNLDIIEQISGGYTTQAVSDSGDTTLSVSDGSTGATLAHRIIEFTGSLTGSRNVTIPLDVQDFYILKNATSGSQNVVFKYATGSGDSATIANAKTIIAYAKADDGTNPNIATVSLASDLVDDTSPQLGGDLDCNSFDILFDDNTGIRDDSDNEQLTFQKTSSAVNNFEMTNQATGTSPTLAAVGGDSNIDMVLVPKGTGETKVGTGSADATITSSGAHNLILDTNSGTNSGTITIVDAANGNIQLTPNGTGYTELVGNTNPGAIRFNCENNSHGVTIKGPAHSASATYTLTLPTSDGDANEVLTTDGSGVLSWAEMSGGTSWQAVQSTGFTAAAGKGYFCNTSSAAFTVTLPASPSLGDEVSIVDYAGSADTNNITVGRNSLKIMGSAADLTVAIERAAFTLVYSDSTYGWLLKDK